MSQVFTDTNFQIEVLSSKIPVLVDFWAPWCGPCRMMAPIIDELADMFDGKIKVGKLNVDENQEIAGNFNIMSIPTMLLFKDGVVVEQFIGAMTKEELQDKLSQHAA